MQAMHLVLAVADRTGLVSLLLAALLIAPWAGAAMAQESAPAAEPGAEVAVEAAAEPAQDKGPELPEALLDPGIGTIELEYRLVPLTKDELGALASEWLAIVKSKTEDVTQRQIAISKAEGEAAKQQREELTEILDVRKDLFDNYDKIVTAWEKKGGDAAAVAEYRAYRNAISVEERSSADIRTLLTVAVAWLFHRDGGIQLGIDIAIVIAAFVALLFVARIVCSIARRGIVRIPNLSKLLQTFLVTVVYWVVLAIGLMVVLSALGVDITPAFALIGGASFILAFAFQDALANLASGLMIMINRPFDRGDYVNVGGVGGTVDSVSIVSTNVVTPDNQVIVIPNKNVWSDVITNVTASDTRRVDLVFGISYEDSISDAIRVMEEAVKAHPLVLDDPEPTIRVHELADSSVNFVCRPWTKTDDYWTVYWDLMRQVKERFDAAGISIPYPQQDVHVVSAAQGTSPFHMQAAAGEEPAGGSPTAGGPKAYAAADKGYARAEEHESDEG